MSRSATSSKLLQAGLAVTPLCLAVSGSAALAQVRLTQDEALRLVFPEPAVIERQTAFLDDDDLARARELAGSEVALEQRVITYYMGRQGDAPLGVAYFDAHRVRTLPEVLMIVVTPDSRIARIEVLKFSEPPEYRAPDGWLEQFAGQALTAELSGKGSIRFMSGATLTSRTVTDAARRALALHEVIGPLAGASRR